MAEMSKKELKEMRRMEENRRMTMEKKASMVKWVVIGIVTTLFIGFFLFLVGFLRSNNPNIAGNNVTGEAITLSNSGEFRVAADSETSVEARPVVITEFADIQCPACKQYHPIIKSVLDLYPETVALNFKHFPISSIHPNAQSAAIAAEAANNQEKFFEMVDVLYERQDDWAFLPNPKEKYMEYAEELGLDIAQFEKDLNDSALAEKIESQRTEGITAGVNSTPSFFVNGVKIQNPSDISGFQMAIDAELMKKGVTNNESSEATPSADSNLSPQVNL